MSAFDEITDWDAFYSWVAARRANDNPRGDFIEDTRDLLRAGLTGRECRTRLLNGCPEAMAEAVKLAREYRRAMRRGRNA